MDALEYKAVATGIRNAIYDMEDWSEQAVVKTVVGRVTDRLIEQFKSHDKGFDSKLFVDAVYGPAQEDPDIPF